MTNLFHRKLLTAALILALIWLGNSAYAVYRQRSDVRAQLRDVESKVAALQNDNDYLASSSAYFSSDEYLERQARLKLNYKPAGEQVAFVYKSSASHATSPASSSAEPFWKRWFEELFRRD